MAISARGTALVFLSAAAVVAAAVIGPVPAADAGPTAPAKRVTACVNKKSGAVRVVTKGRCRKSERRVSWSTTGPTGPAGPTGSVGPTGPRGYTPIVRDATGAVVPGVVSVDMWGVARLVDGGFIDYWLNGRVAYEDVAQVDYPYYRYFGANCTGPLYRWAWDGLTANSAQRFVLRTTDGVTTVYAFSGTNVPVASGTDYWEYYVVAGAPVCKKSTTTYADDFTALVPLGPPPPDLPGPLTFAFE